MKLTCLQLSKACLLKAGLGFILATVASSCGGHEDSSAAKPVTDLVARVDNHLLTLSDVRSAIPIGLSPEDSVEYAKVYVSEWIESHLVNEVATDELKMNEINRLTDEYRHRLILNEYRRQMFEQFADSIPEDSLKAYYEQHKSEFVLERPLIKGTYLKVPDNSANLKVLRRLYVSNKPDDIDRLEKESLSSAIHYDYFRDHWVDWEQIENRIPYDFGADISAWLARHDKLDTSVNSFTYLLYISDILPIGSPMPYENARGAILTRMLNSQRREFEAEVSRRLYSKAIESGRLQVNALP